MSNEPVVTEIELPPDPSRTIEGLRDTGYNLDSAIADIVDNSIAAKAKKVWIDIAYLLDDIPRVTIIDDGTGMNLDDLRNAMKYGAKPREEKGSLGKFGLGLKTASSSICRRYSAISRKEIGGSVYKATWDLDRVNAAQKWILEHGNASDNEIAILDERLEGATGTLILWEKIDRELPLFEGIVDADDLRKTLNDIQNIISEQLSLIFYYYICGKFDLPKVQIFFNGNEIEGYDPLCLDEQKTTTLIDTKLDVGLTNGRRTEASVVGVIIPDKSEFSSEEAFRNARVSVQNQGVYVYREYRQIFGPSWFRIRKQDNHFTNARVGFFFRSDDDEFLKVDIKKSQVQLDTKLRQFFKNQVISLVANQADIKSRDKKRTIRNIADLHALSNSQISQVVQNTGIGGGVSVQSVDLNKGTAIISNSRGPVDIKIASIDRTLPEPNVQIVPSIEEGLLWAPDIAPGQVGMRAILSTAHQFYQKVYLRHVNNESVVQALDYLIWALTMAEMETTSKVVKQNYEEMRYAVSRSLRLLAAELPDVEFLDGDEEDRSDFA